LPVEATHRNEPGGPDLQWKPDRQLEMCLMSALTRGSWLLLTLMICSAWTGAVATEPGPQAAPAAKDTFFFIPHTHWEGAVFKTREEYLDMGLPNILRALALLKARPDYRFVLDQACYVRPFLERYPEEAANLRRFVDEGRLAIVGGTDVMSDVNMPSGESFVRQVLYGKGYFRQALGVDVKVGWQLDTFGHHAQMPQLMKLGGYESFWFFRGVADWNVPAEFQWQGIDGSRIPAFWLPHGYAHTFGSPQDLPAFTAFFKQRFEALAPFARGPGRVGLAGADVCEPEVHLPALIEQFNQQADAPFELRMAVPTDYEAFVAQRGERPVVTGELNPIFQGAYSSRIELKQRTRELEQLLTTAEKLDVLAGTLGLPTDPQVLWRAWEPMLFNQTHDLMSGVMTDHVYEDTIRSYDFSRRIASEEVSQRWDAIAERIDTRGEGMAIAVFNPLGWPRTDVAQADVGFTDTNVTDLSLSGPDGQEVPVQIVADTRYATGGLLRAQIAFIARDVPALGHAVYRLKPRSSAAAVAPDTAASTALENEHYRLEFHPAGGALTRLLVKADRWEALRGPGNVVVREEDHGDLWEPYKPLDGGSRIAMKTQLAVPQPGQGVFSSEQADPPGTVKRGPVFSEFQVSHPFGAQGAFATRVRLYNGLRRIDIQTRIVNQDQFVRYRVLFPVGVQSGRIVHEIPFGAIERPAAIEFPAQNWIDYGDDQHGLALLNRGLPGNTVSDGTIMLSLLRSTRIVAYGFGGGYEPGMSSDSGLELGKEFTFDYALVPHSGDWRQAALYREGLEFNQPLLACTLASHTGQLPARWGLLEITPANVVLTALKPSGSDGACVLRVYEAEGVPTKVTVRLARPLNGPVEVVNLMEDHGPAAAVQDNTLQFELGPFEIKSFKLHLQPSTTGNH
jgi:alpha-mannosidase